MTFNKYSVTHSVNNHRKHRTHTNKTQKTHKPIPGIISKTLVSSYRPTVNKRLVTLKTQPRKTIHTKECTKKNPFILANNTTLELLINGTCYKFFEKPAIEFLLYNLSANKHVDVEKLITPKQYDTNCWFNVMFVTCFVSDKGRQFFHYLRQLMITGTQSNGTPIEPELWKTFALLNYFIDISNKGDPQAKKINTNAIILKLHHIISHKLHIYAKGKPGNPIVYYNTIINYLHNTDLNVLYVTCDPDWKTSVHSQLTSFLQITKGRMPHIVILEFSYNVSQEVTKDRSILLTLNGKNYRLDSACIIDVAREHFSSCLTLEGTDYMYDGMSNHRLIRRDWKKLLNSNVEWSFRGSTNYDKSAKKWSFLKGYHSLHYYLT